MEGISQPKGCTSIGQKAKQDSSLENCEKWTKYEIRFPKGILKIAGGNQEPKSIENKDFL